MLKKYLVGVLLLALFAGCGGQPYTYQDANEIKPGSGLISGEEGAFYLIRAEKEPGDSAEAMPPEGDEHQE